MEDELCDAKPGAARQRRRVAARMAAAVISLTLPAWTACSGEHESKNDAQGAGGATESDTDGAGHGATGSSDAPPSLETPLVDASNSEIRETCLAAFGESGAEVSCAYGAVLYAATTTEDEAAFRAACQPYRTECLVVLTAEVVCGGDWEVTPDCGATLGDLDACFRANAEAMAAFGDCSSPYEQVADAEPFTPPPPCVKTEACAP